MDDLVRYSTTLARWQGDRGTYYHVVIKGEAAEVITMHERIRRLELGAQRGFGSVKVMAQIGETRWKTSVFPQSDPTPPSSAAMEQQKCWWLLVSRKVMRTEDLALDDELTVELELL